MNFDRVARPYALLEKAAFGSELQRARNAFLGEIKNPKRVLIVGEGDGRFLLEFLRHAPSAKVDCLDASAAMLALAQWRLEKVLPNSLLRTRLIHSTIEQWHLGDPDYDLIVTNFFLDCFPARKLESIVAKLARAAGPSATWLLVDFRYPSSPLRRLRARLWLGGMYLFFRAFAGIEARDLIDPTPFLRSHGFACVQQKKFRGGMIKSELWKRAPASFRDQYRD